MTRTKLSLWRRLVPIFDYEGYLRWPPKYVVVVRYRQEMAAYECKAKDGTWYFAEDKLELP